MPKYTDFTINTNLESVGFHEIYASLTEDRERNDIIINDVVEACQEGKLPLLLTERVNHLIL